jgi:transcriptional regulator with XRE-family HTH domain
VIEIIATIAKDESMPHVPLSVQIRMAIKNSGRSRYSIAKAAGMSQSTMSKFAAGHNGLSMEMLDKLGEALGLAIVAVDPAAGVDAVDAVDAANGKAPGPPGFGEILPA